MNKDKSFWDKIAAKYAADPIADIAAYEFTKERTQSYLKASDRVLEIGCGTGSTAIELSPYLGHITASDLSPNMIEIGKKRAQDANVKNIDLIAADVFDPQFQPNSFDVVLAHNMLHLVRDRAAVIAQARQLLKPSGLFISKTVCRSSTMPFKYKAMFAMIPLAQLLGKAPFVNMTTIDSLEGDIKTAGFEIIETGNYPAQPPSRYVVAKAS